MSSDVEHLERLLELAEENPSKPIYIQVGEGEAHGWIVGVEDAEDGPTLLVEISS